jgi:hypothetical protein
MLEYKRTGDRNLLYLEAAEGVIRQYLRTSAFDQKRHNGNYLDSRQINTAGEISYVFPVRVLLLGESLFLLRSGDGFDEICQRLMEQRDLRSAFYETRAARRFFDAGFQIHVRPETKVHREDFDFIASQGSLRVNVEATALREKEFKEKTALNALDRKRDQLPEDKPAVIFCLLPSQWADNGADLNEWARRLSARFLRGTRKINAVVLEMERRISSNADGSKGGMVTVSKAFFNETPRHSADLTFLFEETMRPEEQAAIVNGVRSLSISPNRFRTSEFYKWVDCLVP